jgi:flagellar basal-body rod protein FlgG
MLDVIMQLAARNANRQYESLENVSLNVANYNTTGYKAKRFEQFLTIDNRLDGVSRVDAGKGDLMTTKRELDMGVEGFGYIPVSQPDGTIAYTRDGSFTLDSQGYIVTMHGDIVGEGIKVPANYEKFQIKADGSVLVQTEKNANFEPLGKINLVRFPVAEKLKSIGYNKLVPTAESGEPIADTESKARQGFLERSNVSVHEQVEQILRLNASLISNMRIIKFADDLYQKAVNLRQ